MRDDDDIRSRITVLRILQRARAQKSPTTDCILFTNYRSDTNDTFRGVREIGVGLVRYSGLVLREVRLYAWSPGEDALAHIA